MTQTQIQPLTPAEREARAEANAGRPTLEFGERVPYDTYVQATTLHGLQRPLGSHPGEMSFLVISQVMELYFGLACYELRVSRDLLRADDVWGALAPLRRTVADLQGLSAAWRCLRWMTPADFNQFRNLLGEGSGFQSAMYRRLEFLLGLKTAALIRPFRADPVVYADLVGGLAEASVYDEVIGLMARRGHDIPGELLGRDFAEEHVPHGAVEEAWVRIYAEDRPDNDLRSLGEVLVDVAEGFDEWRTQHVRAVQRAMGDKPGSGGSAGLTWLRRSLERVVFPELWSARTDM